MEARWCSGQAYRPLEPVTAVRIRPGLKAFKPFYKMQEHPVISYIRFNYCELQKEKGNGSVREVFIND